MNNIINIFFVILFLLCWFIILIKLLSSKFAPVKTVKAVVYDKYKPDIVSKYHGTYKRERYIVVFETKHGKLSFDVSEFSYDSYRIRDKGTLKYKGTKIISFNK